MAGNTINELFGPRTPAISPDGKFFYVSGGNDDGLMEFSIMEPTIPTIGQWGLLVLGLLLVVIGVLGVQSSARTERKSTHNTI